MWNHYFTGLALLLILSACATSTGDSTIASPSIQATPISSEQATAQVAVVTPENETPSTLPIPTLTSIHDPTPTPTALPEPTPDLPTPQSGWTWYYNELNDFAIAYPTTWRQDGATFHAPETNSQMQVRVHELPTGQEWLEWVRTHQSDLIFTTPLAPEQVTVNATFQGRPSFFRLDEWAGSSQIILVFPDGDRLFRFYFHSGTVPRLEAEMQVFREMMDSFTLPDDAKGETILPTGWENGISLVNWRPSLRPADLPPEERHPFREGITGTVAEFDPGNFTMTDESGETITLLGPSYNFLSPLPFNEALELPARTETLAIGEIILVIGRPTTAGTLDDQYLAVRREGQWQPYSFQTTFNLTYEALDPELLSHYPQEQPLQLRLLGAWSQVLPYLLDEAGQSLTADTFAIDPQRTVLVQGILQTPETPRILLEGLYVLEGDCQANVEGQELCYPWQQLYPAIQ